MNVSKEYAALVAAVFALSAPAANAQVTEDGMGKVIPVELYACTFNDGQDMEDLEEVIEDWTEYMDGQDIDDYAAWTLMPFFYGVEQEFDFIWMGAFADGNAMAFLADAGANAGSHGHVRLFPHITSLSSIAFLRW